jgi:hypothetical protein
MKKIKARRFTKLKISELPEPSNHKTGGDKEKQVKERMIIY